MTDSSDSITNDENSAVDHVAMRLERATGLLGWLGDKLAHQVIAGKRAARDQAVPRNQAESKGKQPPGDGIEVRRLDRMVDQLVAMCRLVELSLDQVYLHDDLGMAWILLEQARQQLGHAATTAAAIDRSRCLDEDEVEQEVESALNIFWFLQRDRMPWAESASQVVDFGCGPGRLPDFRPDTALELVPLQLLANAVMNVGTVTAVQELPGEALTMAFGEYVFTIMEAAMCLLELRAEQAGEAALASLADTGYQVGSLILGAYPAAWQVFRGPAGLPDAA